MVRRGRCSVGGENTSAQRGACGSERVCDRAATAAPSCCLWVSAATGQSRGGKGEAERSSGGNQVTSI